MQRLVVLVAALTLGGTGLLALPGAAQAAGSLPCDIYGASGTSCVAAYSTVRALYSSYDGPLYQVRRVSDGATTDVGLLAAGATEQDVFCAHITCVSTRLYDQSPEHNDLTIEGPGGAVGQDVGANAAALAVVADGHKVYGLYIAGQTGYRDNGNGHLDVVNLGTECYFSPCTGSGPWVEADMETACSPAETAPTPPTPGTTATSSPHC